MKKPKRPKNSASFNTWKNYERKLDEYKKYKALKERVSKKASGV